MSIPCMSGNFNGILFYSSPFHKKLETPPPGNPFFYGTLDRYPSIIHILSTVHYTER